MARFVSRIGSARIGSAGQAAGGHPPGKGKTMSLSREFAKFAANLRYEDLPEAVVDRAKGVTLQALSSALLAHDMPATHQALAVMQEEEAGGHGVATVLASGSRLTKAG